MVEIKSSWTLADELLASINLQSTSALGGFLFRVRNRLIGFVQFRPVISPVEGEDLAFALHVQMAREFIDLRQDARARRLLKPLWPENQSLPQPPSGQADTVTGRLIALLESIKGADIPENAKLDMIADYWNKWAFVTWERALLEQDAAERLGWLAYVERYLGLIREDFNRASWTPWRINRVRLLLARSFTEQNLQPSQQDTSQGLQDAQAMLNRILGNEPTSSEQTSAK